MAELEIGQTWNVSGNEVEVVEVDEPEVLVEWPSGGQTWEGASWLKTLHDLVAE